MIAVFEWCFGVVVVMMDVWVMMAVLVFSSTGMAMVVWLVAVQY
jgi:hypothetical protein